MIQKYSEFVGGNSQVVKVRPKDKVAVTIIPAPVVADVLTVPVPPVLKTESKSTDKVSRVLICPRGNKLSEALKDLYERKEDNVLYVITEQSDSSLAIVKYDRTTKINLKEFTGTLIDHHRSNEKLTSLFAPVLVEGNVDTTIVKNIPIISKNGKLLVTSLVEDLVRLLG